MKKILIIIIGLLLLTGTIFSQTVIKGKVTDNDNQPLAGANIYIDGTYDGCTSDTAGNFRLHTTVTGQQTLMVKYIGYKDYSTSVDLKGGELNRDITLTLKPNALDAAVITAGTFETSDKKKSILLNPIDIVTTPSSNGDIYGALNTLPGTQTVGEEGKIFVRGGESYETKTFMDGILVNKPYSSRMPDVPARGRFSPFLFNGTAFSTGGYSAEYGQALSSVLSLNTTGLAEKTITGISLYSVGGELSHTQKWESTSLSVSGTYYNLSPYFNLVRQDRDWIKAPVNTEATTIFRQKIGKDGLLKVFGNFSGSVSKLRYPNYEAGVNDSIALFDNNNYIKASYAGNIKDNLLLKTGFSFNSDLETININKDQVKTRDNAMQLKLGFVSTFHENLRLIYGTEVVHEDYVQHYNNAAANEIYKMPFTNNQISAYAEGELNITYHLAFRLGIRAEHSTLLNESVVSPRLALAYKTGENSQFSMAFGNYSQLPQNDYLKFHPSLTSEKAIHYILNYQVQKNDRVFRIETYYKDYRHLVKYSLLNDPNPLNYNNNGRGFAKGVDIFWRDHKTIKNADYWVSYSYIDSKRDYRDYPEMAVPYFISKNNLSVVYKQWISKLSTQLGVTYKYASGRPYTDPNYKGFQNDRTGSYNDLSFNVSYLTRLFNQYTIVHFSVSNLLGFNNVYGYNFSSTPDKEGNYQPHAIIPGSKRFFMLVLMISIE